MPGGLRLTIDRSGQVGEVYEDELDGIERLCAEGALEDAAKALESIVKFYDDPGRHYVVLHAKRALADIYAAIGTREAVERAARLYFDFVRTTKGMFLGGTPHIARAVKDSWGIRIPSSAEVQDAEEALARCEQVVGPIKQGTTRYGPCVIATAIYGSPTAPEVMLLRRFRDVHLLPNPLGRVMISAYCRSSPPVARWLGRKQTLRRILRHVLRRFVVVFLR